MEGSDKTSLVHCDESQKLLRTNPVSFSLLQLTELLTSITWKRGVGVGHFYELRLADFALFLDANLRVAASQQLSRGLLGNSSMRIPSA